MIYWTCTNLSFTGYKLLHSIPALAQLLSCLSSISNIVSAVPSYFEWNPQIDVWTENRRDINMTQRKSHFLRLCYINVNRNIKIRAIFCSQNRIVWEKRAKKRGSYSNNHEKCCKCLLVINQFQMKFHRLLKICLHI